MPTERTLQRAVFTLTRTMITVTRDAAAGPGTFIGHAAVFNSRTAIGNPQTWGFWEEIAEGAFDSALERGDDVRFLVDHDPSKLLGRTASGTLRLSTDKRGLVAEADLPDTQLGRDTRILLDRGDLSQMSFGFVPVREEWTTLDDGTDLVRVLDVEPLVDVSVVTFPAYEETDAAARSAVEALKRRSPLAVQRRTEALERFRKLSPPPGVTRKEITG